jgi:hypothetical protein
LSKLQRRLLVASAAALVLVCSVGVTFHVLRSRSTPHGQPPLAILTPAALPKFAEEFNEAGGQTRVMALLSPTCGVCQRGASAIQAVLAEGDAPIRVFVVWEPILEGDFDPPSNSTLARISDSRVSQYWDPDRSLSNRIVASAASNPSWGTPTVDFDGSQVVWDFVAVYPPGVHWSAVGTMPAPVYQGRPVVDVVDPLRQALASASATAGR